MGIVFLLVRCIFYTVCTWIIFNKANEPGWKALIPIYNAYILAKIAKKKWTFWAKFLTIFLSIVLCSVRVFSLAANVVSVMSTLPENPTDYSYDPYDYETYEEEYTRNENKYTISNLSSVSLAEPTYSPSGTITINGEELTPEQEEQLMRELEILFEALETELGPNSIATLIGVSVIPLLASFIVFGINIALYIGLSQSFGLHGAYALGLLLFKPICIGILAFAPTIRYVDPDDCYASYEATKQAAAPAAAQPQQETTNYDYHSSDYQSTDYNPYEGTSHARVAPDVSEMSEETAPVTARKYYCPNCGYEMDRTPTPDTFCPNCGRLFR